MDRCRQSGIVMRPVTERGPVGEALTRAVAELGPDVLFLGAYGNDRQDRKVLGSTAELILRTLPCPVVLVGPKAIKQSPDPAEPEKIICPIDFSDDVHDRLAIIARFAKALKADVHLVHAVDVQHELSRPHSATDEQFEFDLLVSHLLCAGVAAQSTLLYGTPEEVISERAGQAKAHYIMFGMHKDGNFSSFFRKSLVARVVKIAPAPSLPSRRFRAKGCNHRDQRKGCDRWLAIPGSGSNCVNIGALCRGSVGVGGLGRLHVEAPTLEGVGGME